MSTTVKCQRHSAKGDSITVIIYPKVDLSEFGLPRFLGDMELKPIEAEFKMSPSATD